MTHDQRPLYAICVAAELAGVHPQSLRVYETKGLLDPARTPGGTRLYSDADPARVGRIAELTGAGLNLAGVRAVLELEGRVAALQAELADQQARHREPLAETERRYRRHLVPLHAQLDLTIQMPRFRSPTTPVAIRNEPRRTDGQHMAQRLPREDRDG